MKKILINILKTTLKSLEGEKSPSIPSCKCKTEQSQELVPSMQKFALDMQNIIRKNEVKASHYSYIDFEKMHDELSILELSFENGDTTGFDTKIAARLFLLHNEL